ncbi:hypothetical protein [Propionivibrio sp.]|uniref:hypothetical protein n=1 Tax=Propionivibrio sp. TaxID=2212460 RepID=UPI003BEF5353
MKTSIALAAFLLLGSAAVMAEESKTQVPVQMTVAEMGKVVAGAGIKQQLKDGTGTGIPTRTQIRIPGTGLNTGTCTR